MNKFLPLKVSFSSVWRDIVEKEGGSFLVKIRVASGRRWLKVGWSLLGGSIFRQLAN